MSVRSSFVAVAVVAGVVAVAVGTLMPREVFAQAATLDFAVPSTVPITIAGVNDHGDVLVFTGQPVGFADLVGCEGNPGPYPVQNAVVIDPGAGSTRITNLFVITAVPEAFLSKEGGVKPGTKMVDVNGLGACTSGGISYNRYRGTLQ